jgi:hypothetical protein
LVTKAAHNTARLIASPAAPYSEVRTAACVLAASGCVIARQLIQTGKLDSFGLPMTNLALSSGLTLFEALVRLKLTQAKENADPAFEMGTEATTAQAPVKRNASLLTPNLHQALRNISAAFSLAGSSGLFSNWALNRQANGANSANSMGLFVPIAFVNSAVFKLLVNSDTIPEKALPFAKCITLTGILVGSALFAKLALSEREDVPLFTVSCGLVAGLFPQTLMAIKDVLQPSSQGNTTAHPDPEKAEMTNDTRHTALTERQ